MQPKAGGKLHLRLNTDTSPIADKYREGKLKRTLKRDFNSTWNRSEVNGWDRKVGPRNSALRARVVGASGSSRTGASAGACVSGALSAGWAPRPVCWRSQAPREGDRDEASAPRSRSYRSRRRWPAGGPRNITLRGACAGPRRRSSDWWRLLSVFADRGRSGTRLHTRSRSGSVANRSAAYPTRLETRTRESNMCASHGVTLSSEAQWKWRSPWSGDPGRIPAPSCVGRTTGPSRPQRRWGGARAYTLGPERWWTMPE